MSENNDRQAGRTAEKRISESTIHRVSQYYRALSLLEKEGYDSVSSKELAKREKLTPAQVRKDLSFFGSFAQYIVDDVVRAGIKAILNFAPVNLRVPDDVYLRNENMSMELEYLSFAVVNQHTQKKVRT